MELSSREMVGPGRFSLERLKPHNYIISSKKIELFISGKELWASADETEMDPAEESAPSDQHKRCNGEIPYHQNRK